MPVEITLVPQEDTEIIIHLPDGSTITADALDIDHMVYIVISDPEYKEGNLIPMLCKEFQKAYKVPISRASMDELYRIKHTIMEKVKKNTSQLQDHTDSSIQDQSQTETSSSSTQSKKSSKRKKH